MPTCSAYKKVTQGFRFCQTRWRAAELKSTNLVPREEHEVPAANDVTSETYGNSKSTKAKARVDTKATEVDKLAYCSRHWGKSSRQHECTAAASKELALVWVGADKVCLPARNCMNFWQRVTTWQRSRTWRDVGSSKLTWLIFQCYHCSRAQLSGAIGSSCRFASPGKLQKKRPGCEPPSVLRPPCASCALSGALVCLQRAGLSKHRGSLQAPKWPRFECRWGGVGWAFFFLRVCLFFFFFFFFCVLFRLQGPPDSDFFWLFSWRNPCAHELCCLGCLWVACTAHANLSSRVQSWMLSMDLIVQGAVYGAAQMSFCDTCHSAAFFC